MRRPSSRISALALLHRYSGYTLVRLQGNPALREVAESAAQVHERLNTALQNHWSQQKATSAAAWLSENKKWLLDCALRNVRLAVLATVRNNRKSDRYRAVFPGGFAEVVQCGPAEGLRRAQGIVVKLQDVPDAALTPAVEGLRAAMDSLTVALNDEAAAERSATATTAALHREKDTFCAQYFQIYSKTIEAVGDWRLAETYFRRPRQPRGEEPEAVEPEGPAAGESEPPPSTGAEASDPGANAV